MAVVEDITAAERSSGTDKARNSAASKGKGQDKLRNRTSKPRSDDTGIPLTHPSVVRDSASKPLIDLDSDDESGILPAGDSRFFTLQPGDVFPEALDDELNQGHGHVHVRDEDGEVVEDEVFNTLIYSVPFTFLYLLLDILVHLQYSHRPSWETLGTHLLTAAPTLYMIILYTNRHPTHPATNALLMSASVLSGSRLLWLVNKASWSIVTAQAPPMGTLWILSIVQLPLSRALISLLAVGGWIWYTGLKWIP
ncbi:hypothetical protein IAU60_003898 [Kwoniella sp. DSM 27419]